MSDIPSPIEDRRIRRFLPRLAAGWRRLVLVPSGAAALAFAAASLATPQYHGEARLLIEPFASARNDALLGEKEMAGQVSLLLSADILRQVVKKLDLSRLPEFDSAADMPVASRIFVLAGLKADPGEIPQDDRALAALGENLSVHTEKSGIIAVGMSSKDAGLAAAIPNALAEAYLALQDARPPVFDAAAPASAEVADLNAKVKEAEAKVAAFRARSGLLIGQNSAVQRQSDLSADLSRLRADRVAAEAAGLAAREALKSGASIDALPDGLPSSVLQQLRDRKVKLKGEIADLSTTLLENHPRIRALRAQLADLNGQIRREAQTALKTLAAEQESAQRREMELLADLEVLKADTARAGEQEVELRALEREAEAQRELLETYLARVREASLAGDGAVVPVEARLVASAVTPSQPYFPKVLPIAGAAFAASLLLMAAFAFVRTMSLRGAIQPETDMRVEPIEHIAMPDGHDIEADTTDSFGAAREDDARIEPVQETPPTEATLIDLGSFRAGLEMRRQGALPGQEPEAATATSMEIKIERNDDMALAGEVGIMLATERLISSGATRALFVSPEGDEAAATAVLVAREVSDAGLRVLLLDLTASGAASLPMLESLSYRGITNLLASEAQFTEVIHQDHYSDCHVMPVGTADPARAMRAADRLPIIMESLTTAYDVVIVECGPADADGISRLVAEGTEIFVSVVDGDDEVAEAAEQLKARGHHGLMLVTPVGYQSPNAPVPGRSAA